MILPIYHHADDVGIKRSAEPISDINHRQHAGQPIDYRLTGPLCIRPVLIDKLIKRFQRPQRKPCRLFLDVTRQEPSKTAYKQNTNIKTNNSPGSEQYSTLKAFHFVKTQLICNTPPSTPLQINPLKGFQTKFEGTSFHNTFSEFAVK